MSQKKGKGSSVQFVGTEYNRNPLQPGQIDDQIQEGHYNLKNMASKMRKRAHAKAQEEENAELEEDIILNLQKQIAMMELEIKMLKDQEVEQKNKASGYETLLQDGIPLNEHFLALKNKYNNENNDLEKDVKQADAEIAANQEANDDKKHKIEILRGEYEDISQDNIEIREKMGRKTQDLERDLYEEQHTKTVLMADKKVEAEVLTKLRSDNAISDRNIKQAKLAQNKKEKAHKELREEKEKLWAAYEKLSKDLLATQWTHDQTKRQLEDPEIQRLAEEERDREEANFGQVHIDTTIQQGRIKELKSQKKMIKDAIRRILGDKRKLDKENQEMQEKLNGGRANEGDSNKEYFEAERRMVLDLEHDLQHMREMQEVEMELLKEEEKKCKDVLDLKITAEQAMELLEEDADAMRKRRDQNKKALISQQVLLSQLQTKNKRDQEELADLEKSNETLLKENEKFTDGNSKLQKEIFQTIQRIDVATLIKEVDMEELKMLANNNISMNMGFQAMLQKWEAITNKEEEEII